MTSMMGCCNCSYCLEFAVLCLVGCWLLASVCLCIRLFKLVVLGGLLLCLL